MNKKYKNKKVLIVGLGRSGVSAANLLVSMGADIEIADGKNRSELTSSLEALQGHPALNLGNLESVDISKKDLVVTSPGIPWNNALLSKAREHKIETISELELACRNISSPVIAITGTNGKTTTASMIANILTQGGKTVFLGGNIGTPLSEYVLRREVVDFVVCEVSTFQLEGIKEFKPFISVILNITPDHLDRHSGMDEYTALKKRIFENQGKGDLFITNTLDPISNSFHPPHEVKKILFGGSEIQGDGAFISKGSLIIRKDKQENPICREKDLLVKGTHNVENALAAATVAAWCKVDPCVSGKALSSFKGIPNRMEPVSETGGVLYINDSKGTNVGAAVKSVNSIDAPVILIAGGKDKGGDYFPLKKVIEEKVKFLVLIGEAKNKIAASLNDFKNRTTADSMESAVQIAKNAASSGDVVLLSPACSSFDMYASYEQRGEEFRKAVHNLQTPNTCGEK